MVYAQSTHNEINECLMIWVVDNWYNCLQDFLFESNTKFKKLLLVSYSSNSGAYSVHHIQQ